MQIHILASGSTGNCILLQMGATRLLVDAGISTRRIEKGLAELGIKTGELDGILVTHEHSDHVKGLPLLAKKYDIPVYTRGATWEMLPGREKIPDQCFKMIGQSFSVGQIDIEAFAISHDAADPVGFCFYYRRKKWVVATDLGKVTPEVVQALSYADVAVLESNHDINMLKNGSYPAFLKQRILGQRGHLSNLEAAQLLCTIPRQERMKVFLAHLSQQNNHPAVAERTVASLLKANGCKLGQDVTILSTYPDSRASLVF